MDMVYSRDGKPDNARIHLIHFLGEEVGGGLADPIGIVIVWHRIFDLTEE